MKLKLLFLSFFLTSFVINAVGQTGNSCDDPIVAIIGESNLADHTSGNDQWYSYTATMDGKITVSTCDLTAEDTYVSVYSSCNNSLGSNDNFCDGQSLYSFESTMGVTYLIKWGKNYTSGSYNWSLTEELPAPGDFCSNPFDANVGDNSFSGEQNEYQWYRYTATQDGKITVSSCGNTTDNTNVSVYTVCGGWSVVSNSDFCDSQSKVVFEVVSGNTYYIRWQDQSSSNGFTWTLVEENWAQGEICTNPLIAVAGDTNQADHTSGTTQWYTYTATIDGKITVSTCDLTAEDTYVSVYSSCDNSLGSNDNFCNNQSSYSFECTTGETYLIKWDDFYALNSTYNWSLIEELPAQGDFCSNPFAAIVGDNTFAGEQNQYQWYSFTATQDGKITILSCDKTTDNTNVSIYTTCGGYASDSNNNFCGDQSKIAFEGEAGVTYYVRWQNASSSDSFTWSLTEGDWLQGEVCSNPLAAVAGTANEADHTGATDQWYSYTATIDGKITVSSCNLASLDTRVYVYSDCANAIGSNDDFCNLQSSYTFECTTGTTYLIQWDDYFIPNSTYNWSLTEEAALQGDFCSNPLAAVTGTTNEADHTGATDQWYSYTATLDGKITVSTCDLTTENTRVSVYSDCANAIGSNDDFCNLQSSYTFECTTGTTYLIQWDDSYAPNSTYNWSLTEELPAQGYACSNPFVAVVGDANVADHTGGGDQWYSYESPVNGLITLSTVGLTTEDTYVYVYDNCGGGLIDSNDDINSSEFQSEMSFTGEPDVVYLIKWGNEYTGGTYNWSLMQDGVATDIAEVKENEMNIYVYPNPTSSQFNIQCEKEVELVNIYNTAGILVRQIKGDVKAYSIELAAGLYILDIKLKEGGLVHKRLVVEE